MNNKNVSTLLKKTKTTCVSKFPKDIDEDICICSTSFHVGSKNAHYVLINWKYGGKKITPYEYVCMYVCIVQ